MVIGRAYAFFNASVTEEELKRNLSSIREVASIPSIVTLTLGRVAKWSESIPRDLSRLLEISIYPIFPTGSGFSKVIASKVLLKDLDYVIEGSAGNMSNERVGSELGDLLNGIYYEYEEDSPFTAAVIYEKDGTYRVRE